MNKSRIEAFTDGVTAIIITIMVLELRAPHDASWNAITIMWPTFLSYAISFLFVGLNWASHHHLFQTVSKVNNKILWINMLNLFVLSLVPFATATMGESHFKPITVSIYAAILTLSVLSYLLLINALCTLHGKESTFTKKFHGKNKIYMSLALNSLASVISIFGFPILAFGLLIVTSLAWFIPNHVFEDHHPKDH